MNQDNLTGAVLSAMDKLVRTDYYTKNEMSEEYVPYYGYEPASIISVSNVRVTEIRRLSVLEKDSLPGCICYARYDYCYRQDDYESDETSSQVLFLKEEKPGELEFLGMCEVELENPFEFGYATKHFEIPDMEEEELEKAIDEAPIIWRIGD